MTPTVAFVGATGGAGTTRLTVESGATLARAGLDVAIVDAAFTTQGLASYVEGPIETDVTALVTEEAELGDALYDHTTELPGRLALCPARAPFERLARAQTAGAASEFESQLAAASLSSDVVLVDTPPVGGNHAIAAVNAADHVVVVAPDSPRGADALALTRDRFDDIGVPIDGVFANRADDHLSAVTARIPESDVTDPRACPACLSPDETFAPAIATGIEALLDTELDLEFPESGRLDGIL
jgi:septum site-determining protein MinD